jgi:hypothetical protein
MLCRQRSGGGGGMRLRGGVGTPASAALAGADLPVGAILADFGHTKRARDTGSNVLRESDAGEQPSLPGTGSSVDAIVEQFMPGKNQIM